MVALARPGSAWLRRIEPRSRSPVRTSHLDRATHLLFFVPCPRYHRQVRQRVPGVFRCQDRPVDAAGSSTCHHAERSHQGLDVATPPTSIRSGTCAGVL